MADQSLLSYTRHYLARDYLLGPLPKELCRLNPIDPITDIREPFTFSHSDDLDDVPPVIDQREKLILNHETAVYLSSIIKAPNTCQNLLLEDFRWSAKLHIEEPSVPEQERKRAHRVSEDVLNLKRWPADSGGDSGIEWERDVRYKVLDYVRGIEMEKMVLGSEVLEFLQSIHRPEKPPSTTDMIQLDLVYYKPTNSRLMTPPLLSISPIITPSPIKLSSTLDLKPIDGGETALLIADLTAPFIAADSLLDSPCSESPSNFLQTTPPMESPIRRLPHIETLFVEPLITPPASMAKKVRFVDLPLPPRISTPPGEALEGSLDTGVLSRVSQELAQEQLQEADSTLRVNVPFVDLSLPVLPWDKTGNGLEKLRDLKTWAGIAARKWGGAAGVGVDLSWRPFKRNAVKVPTEDLGSGEVLDEVRVIPSDVEFLESGLLTSLRTMGLAKHEDKEYELEAGVFSVKTDMETLLKNKKRKASKIQKQTQSTATDKNEVGIIKKLDVEAPLSANPLDTFMALRSRISKKPKLSSEEVPRRIVVQEAPEHEKIPARNIAPSALLTTENPTFPRPRIHLPSSPGIFIASTTLLSQRRLFRLILDLYPTATVIERDFTVPIIDHFAGIPSCHKDSAEADLILSTFCGLIFTSLQKIRQAPMPGQALNTTRQRVLDVSLLYERLFVIVLGTLHGRNDSETIAGFVGFAAGLRAGVNIRVLKEDDDVVARWVVSLMIKEGAEGKLLEDETLWERFLRKAGFNAFAAQVVLRHCRDGGLRAFLRMSSDEKRMAFTGVVGGRVMGRVVERLDGEWDTNT